MQSETPGPKRSQTVGDEARRQHQKPEEVAEERRLERMDGLRDMAHPDVHRAEEHACKHHEANTFERVRRRSFADGALGRT